MFRGAAIQKNVGGDMFLNFYEPLNQHIQYSPPLIAGPCAVESFEMLDDIVSFLASKGIRYIRGGIYKPRTSVHSFQGCRETGIAILRQLKDRYPHIRIVSEVVDTAKIQLMNEVVDVFQVGSRNMYHYELLKELGKLKKPVLLKRGLCATIHEFCSAAEYIANGGNEKVIMCERGIRTFETETRNTLDLSCIPIIKAQTPYPVVVDLSHSLGRKDIALPMARAALAAGADALMLEVHNRPNIAKSDKKQQMDLNEFSSFLSQLHPLY